LILSMETRDIALIIVFTALAIVLNPIRIPTLYWPGFFYRLWEIPIVVAFLLFGPKIGVAVGAMNVLAQIVLFPLPAGILAYPWGFVATLSMLLGVYLAKKILSLNSSERFRHLKAKPVFYYTLLGISFRAGIMPFIDYAVYNSLLPIALGRSFTEAYVLALIPGIILFNILVPLYTVPIGYFIAHKLGRDLKIGQYLNLSKQYSSTDNL